MTTDDLTDIDWPALIEKLGGYAAVHEALGEKIQPRAVYLWINREQVSRDYIPAVIALAFKKGIIKRVEDLPRINPFKDPDT